jgi:Predicted dehydrogenases and related proteins
MALTAGADTRPEAVEEFQKKYKNCKAFLSVEEMYASGEIDAVWIATPNVNHADHTVKAAEKGIHVIVEKPTA